MPVYDSPPDHRAVDPVLVDGAPGSRAFAPVPRVLLKLIGIDHFLRVRRGDS